MNYLDQSLLFKFKKVVRYLFLYGPSRTLMKIRGQLHMRGKYVNRFHKKNGEGNVAIVGCGNYSFTTIAYYLKSKTSARLKACCDIDLEKAMSLAGFYGASIATTNFDDILKDDSIKIVFIASNHSTHAEYAIEALNAGKNVHIEKPHVTSEDQLERLILAAKESTGKINLGFNRPNSYLGKKLRNTLSSQPGPGMYNWFVGGHELESDHWYFSPAEGGRVLGNLCHWTDFILELVPKNEIFPIVINPASAESSDTDIVVSFVFGDGTVGCISFSAKGHTFEGVRERLSAHKGNVLAVLEDFEHLKIENIDKVIRFKNTFRDHGHGDNIVRSYRMMIDDRESRSLNYVWLTAKLFLKTKEALETGNVMKIEGNTF